VASQAAIPAQLVESFAGLRFNRHRPGVAIVRLFSHRIAVPVFSNFVANRRL
jgi:hypothetical protein